MNIRNFVVVSLALFSNLSLANFEGLYLGVAPAIVLNGVNLTSNHLSFTNPGETCNSSASFTSFAPSAHLGYAYAFDFGVLGLEADFSYNTNQTVNQKCDCTTNPIVSDQFSLFNQMQGSLRARFGLPLFDDDIMPFVTVGGSIARAGLSYSNESSDSYTTTAVLPGWLVGAGVEWKFHCRFSLRGEYHFASYSNLNLSLPTIYGLTDPDGAAQASLYVNNLKLALSYWF